MNTLDIPRKCVVLRNGKELWVPAKKAEELSAALQSGEAPRFIRFEEEDAVFNTADITGIFTPSDMEELANTKRGMWKCPEGNWHGRFEFQNQEDGGICDCPRTFGNQVLSAGSFEEWAINERAKQTWKAAQIDKSIAPLQEDRARHEKAIKGAESMISFTAEQKAAWMEKQWKEKRWDFINIFDQAALENIIKDHQGKIVKIDKSLDELQTDKQVETTDFFPHKLISLEYFMEKTYPMTPQQIEDFKDFLSKQVW